jgi:hypothetical protein
MHLPCMSEFVGHLLELFLNGGGLFRGRGDFGVGVGITWLRKARCGRFLLSFFWLLLLSRRWGPCVWWGGEGWEECAEF